VQSFSPDELDLPDPNLTQILREAMGRADLVIAVVDPTPASNFVFYESGFAQAINKPTVVLLMGDASSSTWVSSGIPYFRFDPMNPPGLEFAISQVLAIPRHGANGSSSPSRRTHAVGGRIDEWLAQIRTGGDKITEAQLETIIAQAIRASGVVTVSQGGQENRLVDLAVWSDDLSPWVGNPLAIELRLWLRRGTDVNLAVRQLAQAMALGSMPWGLLIYLRSEIDVANAVAVPNIIAISAEQFLEALRDTGFGALVRRLRNQQVHGSCADAAL
jgi:hypothetical protein